MFENISRKDFRIDTIVPAIQTGVAVAASQILGHLGHHTASIQTTVLLTVVAAIVTAISSKIFKQTRFDYYLSIPFGLLAGIGAHRFFYPASSFMNVIDPKGLLALSAALALVKFGADSLSYYLAGRRDGQHEDRQFVREPAQHTQYQRHTHDRSYI